MACEEESADLGGAGTSGALLELHERAQAMAHVGGWRLDLASGRLRLTEESFRIHGRAPAESVDWGDLLLWAHPDDRSGLEAALDAAVRGDRGAYRAEYRIVRPDGSQRWVLGSADVVNGADGAPIALAGALRDVTDQRRAEEQRARLARALLRAQEEERSRIAVELHDNALQILIAISIQVKLLAGRVAGEAALQTSDTLAELVDSAISEVRSLLFELHPPALHLGGLLESLEEYASRLGHESSPELRLSIDVENEPNRDEATVLFQIAREALANSYKHAHASIVTVILEETSGGLEIAIADDGDGFVAGTEVELPGHLGFASIRERAESVGGRVTIISSPGAGTNVRAWIPHL